MPQAPSIRPKRRWSIFSRARSLEGMVGRHLKERRAEEERYSGLTTRQVLEQMGFPAEWSERLLARITPYPPWLKERYDHIRWHLSKNGRLLLMIQQMSRNEVIEAIQKAREARRIASEMEQAAHIREWWREDRELAENDLIDVMSPLYPGESIEFLLKRMEDWSLRSRLREHYAQRRRMRR